MPPSIALSIWFILLLILLRFDPAKYHGTSRTLWVPVVWMSLVASRLPSQWLGGQTGTVAQALEEGNTLDRTIWLALIVLAIAILLARSFRWGDFVSHNLALITYLFFALLSVLWSDFAVVSFKRWFRDLGSYFVILIVLSDSRPYEAVRTVLRRLCYMLIPLSIVLIKYFDIGRAYDSWSGLASNVGVTTTKNMLGVLCVMSALFFVWDTVTRWPDRKERQAKQILFVNVAFIAMTLYLLRLAHSATSTVCLSIGCMVIAAAHSNWGQRHPTFLKIMIPTSFCLYLLLGFGLRLNAAFAEMLGRDPTLTDRTRIWSVLLNMHTDPLFGTGYESFWLGSRLDMVTLKAGEVIAEAHNGYLEVYLNLGLIGLILLVAILVASYWNIGTTQLASRYKVTSLCLGLWAVVLFYNVAEAGFKHGLMWLGLLLGAIVLPEREEDHIVSVASIDANEPADEVQVFAGSADWYG